MGENVVQSVGSVQKGFLETNQEKLVVVNDLVALIDEQRQQIIERAEAVQSLRKAKKDRGKWEKKKKALYAQTKIQDGKIQSFAKQLAQAGLLEEKKWTLDELSNLLEAIRQKLEKNIQRKQKKKGEILPSKTPSGSSLEDEPQSLEGEAVTADLLPEEEEIEKGITGIVTDEPQKWSLYRKLTTVCQVKGGVFFLASVQKKLQLSRETSEQMKKRANNKKLPQRERLRARQQMKEHEKAQDMFLESMKNIAEEIRKQEKGLNESGALTIPLMLDPTLEKFEEELSLIWDWAVIWSLRNTTPLLQAQLIYQKAKEAGELLVALQEKVVKPDSSLTVDEVGLEFEKISFVIHASPIKDYPATLVHDIWEDNCPSEANRNSVIKQIDQEFSRLEKLKSVRSLLKGKSSEQEPLEKES